MMFSMAGIPPLAGFFGKLFVFQAAIDAQLYKLAIVGVLASVIGAFYYLRVIKVMYFDEATEDNLDPAEDRGLNGLLILATLAVVFFILIPGPLMVSAEAAAQSLFQ
jgi:NADH-quinone oxidoreductase subunit N